MCWRTHCVLADTLRIGGYTVCWRFRGIRAKDNTLCIGGHTVYWRIHCLSADTLCVRGSRLPFTTLVKIGRKTL